MLNSDNCPFHPSSAPCNNAGFLQKNNSLEEKSRIVNALKEQSSKNQQSCENSERDDAQFRRTETDFSNLFARGESHSCIYNSLT